MTFEFTLTHSTDQEARILGVWHREVEESVGEHVKERLGNLATRGVCGAKDKTVEQLYDERVPLYEKYADFIVNCDKGSIAENAEKIARQLSLTLL